jgi:Arc/MetJ-type ribon-helix-helix transcriptional regulator
MSMVVPEKVEKIIRDCVASGRYPDEESTFLEALYLLEEREDYLRQKRQQFLDQIDEGIAQLRAGKGIVYDDESLRAFFDRLKERALHANVREIAK